MIFITVGTDLPFDRMMKIIDKWARDNRCQEVFAQIGEGGWKPEYIRFAHFLQPAEFVDYLKSASLIISHAGMGTILSALHYGKPILVMPKKASLGEHRNEHQTATARQMREIGGVNVAFDEDELLSCLNRLHELVPPRRIDASASSTLIKGLSDFIHQRVS